MINIKSQWLLCSGVILFLLSSPFVASAVEYHALLIGVGGTSSPLEGPKNDVPVLKKLLIEKFSFPAQNIRTLIEEEATREAILREIENLGTRSKPGDHLLLYFSGHGTSAGDKKFGSKLPMPHDSGALVPYDAILHGSFYDIYASLIVGRRDVVPRIQKFENDRLVLAVFDACFSQNSVRSISKSRSRYVPFIVEDEASPQALTSFCKTKEESPYPYNNVFFISAASEYEKAWDMGHCGITSRSIDGQPHGLLTDQFIRVLQGEISSDTNNDGLMNFGELFESVKEQTVELSGKYCRHVSTPHALPENSDLQSKIFFHSIEKPVSAVALSDSSSLADKKYPNQSFNVTLDLLGKHGDTVRIGDPVGYSMYTEEDAWLLLINIGPTGTVHVIYPYYESELAKAKAHETVRLENLGEVTGPVGKEVLKMIAFKEKPQGFDEFVGVENIQPGSARYQKLEKLLGLRGAGKERISNSTKISQHTIRVVSIERE